MNANEKQQTNRMFAITQFKRSERWTHYFAIEWTYLTVRLQIDSMKKFHDKKKRKKK